MSPPRYTVLDPKTWRRADHYAWFRRLDYPYMGVTAEVDVTALDARCAALGLSRFAASTHALTGAGNDVPAMRQRIAIEDGRDVVHAYDRIEAGVTLAVDDDLFTYDTVAFTEDIPTFLADVHARSLAARGRASLDGQEHSFPNLFFMSCVPWIRFTQVVHPVKVGTDGTPDSTPRLSWGKFTRVGERRVCPVNVQAHHSLVDGKHLAQFFEALQRRLDAWADLDAASLTPR